MFADSTTPPESTLPESTPSESASPESTPSTPNRIDTGGGSYVDGGVDTGGGDFVGRDKIVQITNVYTSSREAPTPPKPIVFDPKPFEPETILIPAGAFLLGSDNDSAAEKPQHTVTLPAYRIGKTPITNRQYAEFLKRNKKQEEPKKAGWFLRQPPLGKLDYPVVGVSWQDACAYCVWLSQETNRPYRLPTEAEWEKAARGPDGWRYPWGNEWLDQRCNVGANDMTAVTAYPDGASPYGCLDLLGNVQEWTQTIWGTDENNCDYPYPYDPSDGREDPAASQYTARVLRIHRGGYYRSEAAQVRCSARAGSDQATKVTWRGFRVVMEV